MHSPPLLDGARRALIVLFVVSVFNYIDRFVLSVVLPAIKSDLALTDTALGAVATAFTLSYVLFGIPFAGLADRHSRKAIIAVSLALWSAMTAASGLAQNFWQLAVARILVGVGEAGATPPAHSMIADYFPRARRARALSIYGIGAPVGLIIGFGAASWLVETYDWRITFLALGLPGVLFALFCYAVLKEPPRGYADGLRVQEAPPTIVTTLTTLLRSRSFCHTAFATSLYTVVYIAVVTWLPSYFVRSFAIGLAEVGVWLALSVGVSQLIGMLSAGVVADSLAARGLRWYGLIPALAMFVSAPLLAFVFWTDNPLLAALVLAPAFLISIFQGPPSFAIVQAIAAVRMRAMAVALFLLIVNLLGATLGPLLTGWLSDRFVATAGEDSLKWALIVICLVFGLWSGLHYLLAARHLEGELNTNDKNE
ncbi:MAG: MFS transporter [Pseudomonadota bacterium]